MLPETPGSDASGGKIHGTILSRRAETVVVLVLVGGVLALVTFSLPGVLGFVAAVLLAVFLGRTLSGIAEVDERGIVATHKNGRTVAIAWSEPHDCFIKGIRGFVGPVPLGSSCAVRLEAPDGRRVEVASVRGKNDAIVAAIRRRSRGALLPVIRARLAAGETVPFGRVRLSRAELMARGRHYPIAEIAETAISDGDLRVKREGRWLATRVALKHIANYESLLVALGELRR